jgi:hypothetical protein
MSYKTMVAHKRQLLLVDDLLIDIQMLLQGIWQQEVVNSEEIIKRVILHNKQRL